MNLLHFSLATLLAINIFFAGISAQAQSDSTRTEAPTGDNLAISLSVQPLYIPSNAFKLDLELHKPTGRFGYVISPEIYIGNIVDAAIPKSQRNSSSPDRINGFGLGIQQKLKFKKQLISHTLPMA